MPDREKVMTALNCRANDTDIDCRKCDYYIRKNKPAYCDFRGILRDALSLLKEQEAVALCKDCKNWIPGYITDQDDFIPPKCGKYQQMVGHSADDFCSLAEKQEGR